MTQLDRVYLLLKSKSVPLTANRIHQLYCMKYTPEIPFTTIIRILFDLANEGTVVRDGTDIDSRTGNKNVRWRAV